jgi:dsDNA-binding SOS-regulon protein
MMMLRAERIIYEVLKEAKERRGKVWKKKMGVYEKILEVVMVMGEILKKKKRVCERR